MTTPIVKQITRRLEPVGHDPFSDGLRAGRGTEQGEARKRRPPGNCSP
jgi:hypothetical protein